MAYTTARRPKAVTTLNFVTTGVQSPRYLEAGAPVRLRLEIDPETRRPRVRVVTVCGTHVGYAPAAETPKLARALEDRVPHVAHLMGYVRRAAGTFPQVEVHLGIGPPASASRQLGRKDDERQHISCLTALLLLDPFAIPLALAAMGAQGLVRGAVRPNRRRRGLPDQPIGTQRRMPLLLLAQRVLLWGILVVQFAAVLYGVLFT